MSISAGKSRTRFKAQSEEEEELTQISVSLAKSQLDSVLKQAGIQSLLAESFPELFDLAGDDPLGPDEFVDQLEELQASTEGISSEIRANIKRAADEALRLGESDISAFAQRGIENVRDVLAPGRGLRPGDSPILGLGSDIVEEAQRQQGQLTRSVRGAEAGLLVSELTAERANNFDRRKSVIELESSLAQASTSNRLQNRAVFGQIAAGFGVEGTTNVAQTLGTVQLPRLNAPKKRFKQGEFDTADVAALIGASASACWVAAEFYGWGTPAWWSARTWLMEDWRGPHAAAFRWLYRRYGERVAGWVRQSPRLRATLRPFFEWARRRGEAT